jgi:DNA-binding LytR/AlgR family response regulator
MTDKRTVTATFNLSEIRGKLSEDIFIRVHRSVILNINHVTKFVGNVIFVNDEYFPVGRKFRKPLLQRLNLLGNSNRLFVRE